MAAELDVLKEIPGYKAILKSVLKSQIQMLMEQLSDQTGEESIILTASVHDGSLSHLGSSTGKGFLEGRDEIKAQFLGYCLKSQHTKESMEAETQQYSRSRTLMPPARRQRPRIRPAPYSISSPGSSTSVTSSPSFPMSSQHALNSMKHSDNMTIKPETANVADSFLDSVTGERDPEFPGGEDSGLTNQASNQNESFDSSQSSSQDDAGDTVQTVKLEPQENNDLELTGVELGDNSLSSDNWGQSYGSSTQHDGNQTDKNSYNGSEQTQKVATSHHNVHFGGIAFPGLDNAHHDFSSRALPDMSPADLKQALYPQGMFKNANNLNQDDDIQSNHISVLGQFDPSPRKRGRPRKVPSLPSAKSVSIQMAESSPPSQNNQENDMPEDNLIRKRGRPRKDLDEALPPGVVRPMGISIGNGYVKCSICGKILKATSMFSHKQSHLGIRNYSCEYCGKSFTQKGPLITHKRVHTGEKPYSCPRCGKAFAAHSGLYQHSRRCARHAAMEHFNLTM